MPRLEVDDGPQHGTRTGTDCVPQARTTPKRRVSPKTTAQPNKKSRTHPSPRSQAVIAALREAARAQPPKKRKRTIEAISREYNVGQQYPRQIAAQITKKKQFSTRKGVGGNPPRVSEEDGELIISTLKEHAYELTYKQLEEKTGIPSSTLQRWCKDKEFRMVAKGTRPLLDEDNIKGRLKWAQDNEKNDWMMHVDLDEKIYYALSKRVKLKLPPGHDRPKQRIKSKRFVPKVMVLTAIARPHPRHDFDGLIGIWRVQKKRTHPDGTPFPAQRGDKRTGLKKGDDIWLDCTLDGPMFEKMLREQVIPAIREKMSWARVVTLQFDNAPGHTTQGRKDDEGSAIADRIADTLKAPTDARGRATGPEIRLLRQEPNSPCTNGNDLGFYNSMDSRLPAKRPFKLDDLYQLCEEGYWEYPPDKLDDIFAMKARVVQSIIAAGGDNDFKLPRKKK